MIESDIISLEKMASVNKVKEEYIKERANRLNDISKFIKKPRGLFNKKCPNCGLKLKLEIVREDLDNNNSPDLAYSLYSCTCGYEYGEVVIIPYSSGRVDWHA